MELSPQANVGYIKDYLFDDLKERSIRYINLMIDLELVMNVTINPISSEMRTDFEKIKEVFKNKDEEQCVIAFRDFTEQEQKNFNTVNLFELQQKNVERINDEIRNVEARLTIINELIEQLSLKK